MRYDFYSLLISDINRKKIWLEYPHGKLDRKKIDTYIEINNGVFIEFKFFRRLKSKQAVDRTGQIASLFADFMKLHCINPNAKKYVIVLTDDEMLNYIKNKKNMYNSILEEKTILSFNLANKSKHFKNEIKRKISNDKYYINEITIRKIFDKEIGKCRLFVFQI